MSRPEPTIQATVDVRTTRVVLVVLVALWAALLVWTWRHGEVMLGGTDGGGVSSPDLRNVIAGTSDGRPSTGSALPDPSADPASGDGARVDEGGEASGGAVIDESGVTVDDPVTDSAGSDLASANAGTDTGPDVAAGPVDGNAARANGEAEVEAATDDIAATDAVEPEREVADDAATEASSGSGLEETDADAEVAGIEIESVFEVRRREEIETLSRLLERLSFEPLDDTPSAASREPLERAFEILFLYPDTRLRLVVESRETNDVVFDRDLSRERAETVIDYLASRGIERERLSGGTGDGSGLPFGGHRVRVTVEDESR